MWPDQVSNSEPLAIETDAIPTALRGPAKSFMNAPLFYLLQS